MACLGSAISIAIVVCLAFVIYVRIRHKQEDREYAKFLKDERWKWASLNSQTGKEPKVTPGYSWDKTIDTPFPGDEEDDDSDLLLGAMLDNDEEFPIPQSSAVGNDNQPNNTFAGSFGYTSMSSSHNPYHTQTTENHISVFEGDIFYCHDKKRTEIFGKKVVVVKAFARSVFVKEEGTDDTSPVYMMDTQEFINLLKKEPPIIEEEKGPEPFEFLDTK